MVEIPDGSGRFLVAAQEGVVVVLEHGRVLEEPLLDISHLVACCDNGGLLSIALHPLYAVNRYMYLLYVNNDEDTVLARFTDGDVTSQRILLEFDQPPDNRPNHHGGQVTFGPDGYLWLSMGDGGAYQYVTNRAQELWHHLGKILRIDVDRGDPYAIPADNPFVAVPGARPEIWAYGLRNPWRYSFDRLTRDLILADVGQDLWEEINFQSAISRGGENYGWPRMEGAHCFGGGVGCNDGSLTLPVLEYSRGGGCSVTGGFVYRGNRYPGLRGTYFYADFCSGKIWGAARNGSTWSTEELLDSDAMIVSFAEDLNGELYVLDHQGTIYQIYEPEAPRRRAVRR